MAKAKKLPSGNYRALAYDYTDASGKRHYKSFTASTAKEAQFLAAEFALNKKELPKYCDMYFAEARERYIDLKSHILSPASIRGYKQMSTYYESLDNLLLSKITQQHIQNWANSFSINHAPKTVRNAHGFITAVLKQFRPDMQLSTALPQKVLPQYYVPSDSEITALITYLKENDAEMLKAVYLAAFATLRRSEICALDSDDIDGDVIHIHRAMVKNANRMFEIKTTKTVSSDRFIPVPQFVIDSFPSSGRIVSITPDIITHRFNRILKRLSLPHFRFHDLRHYSASIMHAIGVPDQYIMLRGGWSSDTVLKQVYRGTMDDYSKRFTAMTNSYFDSMQHEIQHKKEKP